MAMNKLKTLLGTGNVIMILASLIKYSILCVMFRFMNPWVVSSIWLVVGTSISFFMLCINREDSLGTILVGTFCFCMPFIVLQAILYYYTFKYIGWFGVPALAIANTLMWMLFSDDEDEPRTKTTPSDKEAIIDESNYVDDSAQEVSSDDGRFDPDGNSGDKIIVPKMSDEFCEKFKEAKEELKQAVVLAADESHENQSV